MRRTLTALLALLTATAAPPARAAAAILQYFHLGRALQVSGRLDDAEGNLRQAVRLDPTNPLYHRQLALLLREAGKTEEAEREMQVHRDLLQRKQRQSDAG